MLTFAPAMDPQSDLKKALKMFKIGVEKRYSVLTPKWTVLGVDLGSKKGAKIELDVIWTSHGLHMDPRGTHRTHMDLIWTPYGAHMTPKMDDFGIHMRSKKIPKLDPKESCAFCASS